jgi:hypothetical protein
MSLNNLYYIKYLKYKIKYLEIKGGTLDENKIDTKIWTKINNKGQQNCGIYINNNKLLKCISGKHNKQKISFVKKLQQYFPKIHEIDYNDKLVKTFITMEKLDGDITSIFFELLPKIAINKTLEECNDISLEINHNTNTNNFDKNYFLLKIFSLKIPSTMGRQDRPPYIEFHNYINDVNLITLDDYEQFINKIKILFNKFFNFIIIEIINLLYKLYKLNYIYSDFKFDNYAYKLLNDDEITSEMSNHYKCENKFLSKNLFIYIIDWDSGLFERETQFSDSDLNKLLTCYKYISHNGQYNIDTIGIGINIGDKDSHLTEFTNDIKTIFDNTYKNNTIEQFEEYISQLIYLILKDIFQY